MLDDHQQQPEAKPGIALIHVSPLSIQLEREEGDYVPGEPIIGAVSWNLEVPSDEIVIRLTWKTNGKGETEVGFAGEQRLACESSKGSKRFEFPGIQGPYSFKGALFALQWHLQVSAAISGEHHRKRITIAPTRVAVEPNSTERAQAK